MSPESKLGAGSTGEVSASHSTSKCPMVARMVTRSFTLTTKQNTIIRGWSRSSFLFLIFDVVVSIDFLCFPCPSVPVNYNVFQKGLSWWHRSSSCPPHSSLLIKGLQRCLSHCLQWTSDHLFLCNVRLSLKYLHNNPAWDLKSIQICEHLLTLIYGDSNIFEYSLLLVIEH